MVKSKSKPAPKKRTPAKGTPVTPAKGTPVTPAKGTPVIVKDERSARHAVAKPAVAAVTGPTLRSLRSVIYTVDDLSRAKAFYATVLGKQPYFDQPFYVGFEVDGAELGLDPDTKNRKPGPGGAVAYWRVGDISAAWEFSIANGGDPLEPPHAVGGDISVAVIADPSGNYVGLIQTP
jgi:predicted enzyme related to lactoylglutathione lyase